MGRTNPPRSYLFVPGNRPERFAKALATEADRVVLDLEDAVSPHDKVLARGCVAAYCAGAAAAHLERLVVRINDDSTDWFEGDCAMLAAAGITAVMLPKAEWPATVARVVAAVPAVSILALIETARGVLQAQAVAESPGVRRLAFGTIDFALDLGLSDAEDPVGLDAAAARLAWVSRACGLAAPVAGVTVAIGDDDRLRADLARARAHGYGAKLCVHPRQVAVLHDALRPSEAEIAWAERVIAALANGKGATQLDGRMIDKPLELRARGMLARR